MSVDTVAPALFTVFGGRGFIGNAIVEHLRGRGHTVDVPPRDVIPEAGQDLGHVVYAIGLTSDFRVRPMDTIEAHVCALKDRILGTTFRSWLYLSSTRVYSGQTASVVDEDTTLLAKSSGDGVFNLSKLLGEALCLALPNPTIRCARVSNVYGHGAHDVSFLGMLLADVRAGRSITIGEGAASAKDYVSIGDVCTLVEAIALKGHHRLYNVASGVQVTHREIAEVFTDAGASVSFANDGQVRIFPRIDMARAIDEFGYTPERLGDALPEIIRRARHVTTA